MSNSGSTIVLTGFMATGKSTTGQLIAQRLARVFIDTDQLITERTSTSIPQLFGTYGEPFFRVVEKGICHEVAIRPNLVVATGGGALMDADTRAFMIQHCMVVCLGASPSIIEQRLGLSADRPLAANWRNLLESRLPVYRMLPYQIDTSDKYPEQVAEEIITLWSSKYM